MEPALAPVSHPFVVTPFIRGYCSLCREGVEEKKVHRYRGLASCHKRACDLRAVLPRVLTVHSRRALSCRAHVVCATERWT